MTAQKTAAKETTATAATPTKTSLEDITLFFLCVCGCVNATSRLFQPVTMVTFTETANYRT